MAKRDKYGNLITAPNSLKNLYLNTYKERLNHRVMESNYKELEILKTELWNLRFKRLRQKVSDPWTTADFDRVA